MCSAPVAPLGPGGFIYFPHCNYGRSERLAEHSFLAFLLPPIAALQDGEEVSAAPTAQTIVFKSRMWDVDQKALYMQNDELVAGHLQGPNSALEEKIYWVHNRAFDREKFPVILSIQDGKRCLACSSGAGPVLQLESIDITDLCTRSGEESARFTFFRSYVDGIWRFESAAHPGWFLCTSLESNEPLGLAQALGRAHVVDFYFQSC